MPIRADLRQHYGPAWRAICRTRCEAAGWRCEWCGAANDQPPPKTSKRVVLTVAHLNHDPADNRPENLRALCQPCHLHHDAAQHRRSRAANLRARLMTGDLFGEGQRG